MFAINSLSSEMYGYGFVEAIFKKIFAIDILSISCIIIALCICEYYMTLSVVSDLLVPSGDKPSPEPKLKFPPTYGVNKAQWVKK